MDIPTAVAFYEEAYQDWFSKKLQIIGKPEKEPTFDFFLVKKLEEIQ
jgi:hypothetical protein